MTPAPLEASASDGGYWLVLAILLPCSGILAALALGGRNPERIALGLMPVQLFVALAIAAKVWNSGKPLVYDIGGWAPPLGISLRADGFSAVMLVTAALIMPAAGIFARKSFSTPQDADETRTSFAFWILMLGLWTGLNVVFLGGDLFNLFVALEILTFTGVPLVCLDGRAETLTAALRYLLFALLGSVLYLLGAGAALWRLRHARHCAPRRRDPP